MAPTPSLATLMTPGLPGATTAGARRDEILLEVVQAVLPNGRYRIRGVDLPVSGLAQLAVGTVVPVYWRAGQPVVILAHNARRAPAIRRLAAVAPCVEELLYTGGHVYFRNDQQLTVLTAVDQALKPSPVVAAAVPSQLVWGERDDTFCVVADMPAIGPATAGIRYFIFKLNREAGDVLDASPATATLLDTPRPPTTPLTLAAKYDSVNNSYANGVGGRVLAVTCPHATFAGVTAITPVYLSQSLDVLAVVAIQAVSQFSFSVIGLNTGRLLGIIQWLNVFSFKQQKMIWESPVSVAAEPLVLLGACGFVSGALDDATLITAKNTYLPGPEPSFIVSGRILAWDERDVTRQLVAVSVTKTLYAWSGRLSGGEIVGPGDQSVTSRLAATFIQNGSGTTVWAVLPYTNAMPTPSLAMSFKDVRVGPRSLRVLGITTIFDSDTLKEVNVLDITQQTTRKVLDGAAGSPALADAIAPSDGALFIVEEAAAITAWPAETSRGHFASAGTFMLATVQTVPSNNQLAKDDDLEEFEGLSPYPTGASAVTPPSGSGPRVAYHVVRTDDITPLLPVLPATP